MEILIGVYWSLAFTVIISFLGGLTYYIQGQILTDKFLLVTMYQQQGRRGSGSNRRKNARNANRNKQQQQQTTTNIDLNNTDVKENQEQDDKEKTIIPETTTEEDQQQVNLQSSVKQTDEEHERFEGTIQTTSPPTHIDNEQLPIPLVKQQNKNKTSLPHSREEPILPSKPQASVAPVKQMSPLPLMKNVTSNNFKLSYTQQDKCPKSNGNAASNNMYTYSGHNPLPPRFQQQRQKEAAAAAQKSHRRKGRLPPERSTLPPGSAARPNDFVPLLAPQEQINDNNTNNNNNQLESSVNIDQQELLVNHDYSSESDILSDSPSTAGNTSFSPLMSISADSQASLQRLDFLRSVTSNGLLEQLISIFDTISFSSEELEVIMNKVAAKHILNKQDLQRLLLSTKTDKAFERILDETYRNQVRILAIELQAEKTRILELTKSNADMDALIRQLQQQPPNSLIQYQQIVLPFQIQIRRLVEENTRLQHQLHAYSMMPGSINELKQQQHVLNEQIRQMTLKCNALENEVADSERGSKHAAELYKKADAQKQERIEQMIADINKYRKLDKELTNLRQQNLEREKDFNSKINNVTHQRDDLQVRCDQLTERLQQYDQLQIKYNQLIQNNSTNVHQQELNGLKAKNDQLQQQNSKQTEELNKFSNKQQNNPITKSS